MIPPPFDCVRARTVEEAVSALAESGNGKLLAGGQSFLPILRLRLAYPEVVVDLGRTSGMWGIRDEGDELVIGAMTSHYEVMTSDLIRQHCGLLAKATSTVADPQVRHRGTFGGALSHADPAGDLPAVALAFGSTMVVAGPDGRREVPASEFFADYLQTALGPADVLVEVRVPKLDAGAGWGYHYEKFQRVAQAWAIVAVAALVRRSGEVIDEARLGLVNMGATPLRATAAEDALAGARANDSAVADAAALAAEGTSPPSDLSGQAGYRRHLARVLTRSAVLAAAGMQTAG
jgi:carbon-monoxide dehydrogenase medium subunit